MTRACPAHPPSSLVLEGIGWFVCLAALALSFILWLGAAFGNLPPSEEFPGLVIALGLAILGWLPPEKPIRATALVMIILCVWALVGDLSYYQHEGLLRDFFVRCLIFLRS